MHILGRRTWREAKIGWEFDWEFDWEFEAE